MLNLPTSAGPRHKLYETMVTTIYNQELSPGDSFIDLGANVGHHTWQMATRVGPEGRGFAIEPVPDFAGRVQNVLAHKKIDWVEILNVAASDYEGECSFFVQPDHIGWSSMFSNHVHPGDSAQSAQEITVEVRQIDDLIDITNSGPISAIKVDIENAEFAGLRGATRTIEKHRPVVIFENNPLGAAKFAGYEVSDFFDFFTNLGYHLWSFHGEKISTANDWAQSESVYYCATSSTWDTAEDFLRHYGLDEVVANFEG